jgi:hypothetical protein
MATFGAYRTILAAPNFSFYLLVARKQAMLRCLTTAAGTTRVWWEKTRDDPAALTAAGPSCRI